MRRLTCAVVVCLAAASAAWAAEPEDPWRRAAALESAGLHSAAAAQLAPLATEESQDFALFLRLGWLCFQAGDYACAERSYRRAESLTPESYEARLGLAWTAQRRGASGDASRRFSDLAAERPDDPSARQGAALARADEWVLVPRVELVLHDYGSHPYVQSGVSLGAAATVRRGRWSLDGGYRYSTYPSDSTDSIQHQGHLGLGWHVAAAGWKVWGAYLTDDVTSTRDSYVLGARGRWSPWGDLVLDLNGGRFNRRLIPAAQLAWSMPVTSWLNLVPLVQAQSDTGGGRGAGGGRTPRGAAGGRLELHGDGGALWVGARAGSMRNPVDADLPALYTLDGVFGRRANVGGRLDLGEAAYLTAGVEWAEVTVLDYTGSEHDTTARWVGLSVGTAF